MREIKFRVWDKETKAMIEWERMSGWDLGTFNWDGLYDFMQFTGIKDKNKKDIYEGDIISTGKTLKGEHICFRVVYYFDRFGATHGNYKPSSTTTKWFWQKSEVVGNIYETPQLLK